MTSPAVAKTVLAAVLTASFLAPGGCAPMNLRGNGFGDESSRWGQNFRPPTQAGNMQGIDNRAREIEQNLGVR